MGLKEILNKNHNAKSTIIYSAIIIGSTALGLSHYFAETYKSLKKEDYDKKEAVYEALLDAQDGIIGKQREIEAIYKVREMYYKAILGLYLNRDKNRQEEQLTPTIKNPLHNI